MSNRRKDDAKARRRERAKRADRHRRLTADKCAYLLCHAESAFAAGQLEPARRLFEQILRIRPTHEIANACLADLHFKAERYEAGLACYDRLSQRPDYPAVVYNAAFACLRTGRFDQGETLASEFETDRTGFPASVRASDFAPVDEVQLRCRYAELRLQKGFDELLSLGAGRDVTHFRYQLDSVRRILRDFRGRVLLADEVGLGKTIEACLTLKEYWMRGLVRKALILTPPSLVGMRQVANNLGPG